MLRIAICDDEKYYRRYIEKHVSKYMRKLKLNYEIDIYSSGKAFAELGIEMSRYNIIFLDINMNEMDGIEIAQQIRTYSKGTYIVFVTAFISYALEGYKVNAVRYLLKDSENFEISLSECIDAILEKMDYEIIRIHFTFIEAKGDI